MRRALHKIFKTKENWNFQRADLAESTKELRNASRGWYQLYTFWADKRPDFKKLFWCGTDDDTLAMVIINIGEYREKPLDAVALKNIREILDFFATVGYDIVLRVVYDHEGKAVEREPFFFARVKEHISQLMPVVREYAQAIFVFQGMLIGNWGEMHTSRFLAPGKLKEMWSVMTEGLEEDIFFAVRRPVYWRILHPDGCGKQELPYDGMGLFDDAIFGSETHLGTFGAEPKENSGWDNLWSRSDELEFEDKLCMRVPNGGEVVCGEQYLSNGNMNDTLEILQKMHITYLNRHYDPRILDVWKELKCEIPGVWQGMNMFDYVGRHLGYRFWIKDVTVTCSEESEDRLLVSIQIENVGFANYYQEGDVRLEWRTQSTGELHIKEIECDMRRWDSGSTQTISCEIGAVNCSLYLAAVRKADGKKIFFANQAESGGRYFLGKITGVRLR